MGHGNGRGGAVHYNISPEAIEHLRRANAAAAAGSNDAMLAYGLNKNLK